MCKINANYNFLFTAKFLVSGSMGKRLFYIKQIADSLYSNKGKLKSNTNFFASYRQLLEGMLKANSIIFLHTLISNF